jgi:hypothetical protein
LRAFSVHFSLWLVYPTNKYIKLAQFLSFAMSFYNGFFMAEMNEKAELGEWVPKVEDAAKNVEKVYGYFNNHFHGYAPENCLYLIEKLGLLSEEQKKAEQKASVKQRNLALSLARARICLLLLKVDMSPAQSRFFL